LKWMRWNSHVPFFISFWFSIHSWGSVPVACYTTVMNSLKKYRVLWVVVYWHLRGFCFGISFTENFELWKESHGIWNIGIQCLWLKV
jgi:hypothetical protein